MARWRSNKAKKRARLEREGKDGRDTRTNKNVDERGWVITRADHPDHREPSNPVFEAFYQAQGIVPPEEWKTFMKTLLEPLPASFRINLDCDFADL